MVYLRMNFCQNVYMDSLVYTSIYEYILVYTRLYQYIHVYQYIQEYTCFIRVYNRICQYISNIPAVKRPVKPRNMPLVKSPGFPYWYIPGKYWYILRSSLYIVVYTSIYLYRLVYISILVYTRIYWFHPSVNKFIPVYPV